MGAGRAGERWRGAGEPPVRRHRRLLFATLLAISFLAGSLSTIVAVSITGGWYERVTIGRLGACEELLDQTESELWVHIASVSLSHGIADSAWLSGV